ncbi:MAG: HesA/MoeB/ThiF family protein [Eubacterium sp.]|nr:HesA/MoeB/ThiF family protein [Eubacterium sp.]
MALSKEQQQRYARHFTLDEVGEEGQEKLLGAKVCIIGAGGLGSPAAFYLAAAGIGTIGIADADAVELSNLQRQILHGTADIGRKKALSAKGSLERLNPDTVVHPYPVLVNEDNIADLIDGYDMVLDAADNFETKFLINDACVRAGKPFVHAGVIRFQGQLMTYVPGQGPCYRCIFKEPPPQGAVPSAKEAGVLGAACGVIGSLQAMEVVKYVLGAGELLTGRLLVYDALSAQLRTIKLPERAHDCRACGCREPDVIV